MQRQRLNVIGLTFLSHFNTQFLFGWWRQWWWWWLCWKMSSHLLLYRSCNCLFGLRPDSCQCFHAHQTVQWPLEPFRWENDSVVSSYKCIIKRSIRDSDEISRVQCPCSCAKKMDRSTKMSCGDPRLCKTNTSLCSYHTSLLQTRCWINQVKPSDLTAYFYFLISFLFFWNHRHIACRLTRWNRHISMPFPFYEILEMTEFTSAYTTSLKPITSFFDLHMCYSVHGYKFELDKRWYIIIGAQATDIYWRLWSIKTGKEKKEKKIIRLNASYHLFY